MGTVEKLIIIIKTVHYLVPCSLTAQVLEIKKQDRRFPNYASDWLELTRAHVAITEIVYKNIQAVRHNYKLGCNLGIIRELHKRGGV